MKRLATTLLTLCVLVLPAQAQDAWTYDREINFPESDTAHVFPYLAAVADDGTLYVISSRATDTTAHNALWKADPGATEMELVEDYSSPRDANILSTRGITTIGNDVLVSSQSPIQPGGIGYGHIYYYEGGDPERRLIFNSNNGYGGYGTFTYGVDATDMGYVFSSLSYQTSVRVFDYTDPDAAGYGSWIAQLDDQDQPIANVEVEGHDTCALSAIRDIAVVPGMDYTSEESRFFTSRSQSPSELPDGCASYSGGIAVWEGATAENWAEYESSRVTDFFGDLAISSFVATGITADSEGRLWMTGPDESRLWVKAFDVIGDVAQEALELPSQTSQSNAVAEGAPFESPNDVALNADEDVAFVTDLFAKKVFVFTRSSTSIEHGAALPDGFMLKQNYPNPFNPSTKIDFELDIPTHVRLVVHDVLGREVAVLAEGVRAAGSHTATFDAGNLPSGIYLYRLEANGKRQTRALLLSK